MFKSGENGLNRIKQRIWSYLSPIGVPNFIYLTIKINYKVKVSLVAQIDSSKPSILSCPFSLDFYMLDIYQIFIWKVFKNFPFQFILTPSRAQRVGFLCKLCDPHWQFQTGVYTKSGRTIYFVKVPQFTSCSSIQTGQKIGSNWPRLCCA